MYRVGVRDSFNAAHMLEGHPGKCARLHGHTWQAEAVFASADTGPDGIVLDFEVAADLLARAVAPYDHTYLNDLEAFKGLWPTAERLAATLYKAVVEELEKSRAGVMLERVTVWESPDSWASYGTGARKSAEQ